MADETVEKDEEVKEKEVKEVKETPEAPDSQVDETKDTTSKLDDDQVASLKDSITKDISGQVSDDVSKSVIEKIGEALGLTKKEKEDLPRDQDSLNQVIDQRVKQELSRFEESQQKREEISEKQRQQQIDTQVNSWFSQYDQLARSGKVPKIENLQDQNDKGRLARNKIITAIGKMIDQNKDSADPQVRDYVPTISDVLLQYPNVLDEQLPGANLPISGSNAARYEGQGLDYQKDIRGKSFEQIVNES